MLLLTDSLSLSLSTHTHICTHICFLSIHLKIEIITSRVAEHSLSPSLLSFSLSLRFFVPYSRREYAEERRRTRERTAAILVFTLDTILLSDDKTRDYLSVFPALNAMLDTSTRASARNFYSSLL